MTPLLLALRFLNAHRVRTLLLLVCFVIVFLVPLASRVVLSEFGDRWMRRAAETPLVLGARGSEFDLALFATWYQGSQPDDITMADWREVRESGYAASYPLNITTTAQQRPLVATSVDYLRWRGLTIAEGRSFLMLGECVLGHEVARDLGLGPGDFILTDPPHSFSLASPYPLEMEIVGVLAPADSPDDHAVFTDLKTAWVAQGIGHGHEDLRETDQPDAIREERDGAIIASPALMQYTRITRENRASFHFHGDPETFPLSAVIIVPHGERSEALLLGRYLSPQATVQVTRPAEVLDSVLNTILRVQTLFDFAFVLLMTLALLFLGLIVFLTLKVRQEEMETLRMIGASRRLILLVQVVEYAVPIAMGLLLALLFSPLVVSFSSTLFGILVFWRFA